MKSLTRISLIVVGLMAVVALVVAHATWDWKGPSGSALYSTPIRVKGQVVDARTGAPLSGATIYVLSGGSRDVAERDLAELLEHAAEYPEESGNYGPFGARLRTDDDGTFDVTLRLSYCCAFGPGIEREYPPPRYGAGMVLVEREGYARTFFPTETGTWTVLEQKKLDDPYGLVGVRVLRLPPAE